MRVGNVQQPQIILLKEGTDTSQGKAQLVSNINACTAVADVVRTTLGPRGMDKLIHDDKGNVTISNDGATIMKLLDIVHPAAKILVDIAKSQDSEVFSRSVYLSFSLIESAAGTIVVDSCLSCFWLFYHRDIDRIVSCDFGFMLLQLLLFFGTRITKFELIPDKSS